MSIYTIVAGNGVETREQSIKAENEYHATRLFLRRKWLVKFIAENNLVAIRVDREEK